MRFLRRLCAILLLALLCACAGEQGPPLPSATTTLGAEPQMPTASPAPTSSPTTAPALTDSAPELAEVIGAVRSIAHAPLTRVSLEPNDVGIATLLLPTEGVRGQQLLPLIDMLHPCLTISARGMRTGDELMVGQLNIVRAEPAPLGRFPATVTLDQAPIYDNPGPEPGVVGRLAKGAIVSLRGRCGEFYGVITLNGRRGWVEATSVTVEEAGGLPTIPPDPGRGSDDPRYVINAIVFKASGLRYKLQLDVDNNLETYEYGDELTITYDTGQPAALGDLLPGTRVLAEVYPGRMITRIMILTPEAE